MNSSSVVSERIAAFAVATAKLASSKLRYSKIETKPVSCISTSKASCVCSELLNSIVNREEVSGRLGHLLVVQLDVAIAEERTRHLGAIGPNRLVDVKTHHQMVLDQVFSTHTQIEGIPILELMTQLLKLRLFDSTLRGIALWIMECPLTHSVAEDVIKYFRSQLVGTDAQWTHLFTKEISLE